MGRNGGWIDHRDENTGVRDLSGVTPVAAHDAANGCASSARTFKGTDKVGANVFRFVATSNGEYENHVLLAQAAATQPSCVAGVPAVVVDAGGEFGDIIRRGVGLDLGDLTEVADGVRGMPRAAAHSEEKEPAAALSESHQAIHDARDSLLIYFLENGYSFFYILFYVIHGFHSVWVALVRNRFCQHECRVANHDSPEAEVVNNLRSPANQEFAQVALELSI